MKAARTSIIVLGIALMLTGCQHKTVAPPPPAATAPPLPPSSMTHAPTLPPVPQPDTPKVGPPGSEQAVIQPEPPPPPKHTRRSKKHLVTPDSTQIVSAPASAASTAPATTPQTAAAPPPSAPEPSLGQLSAGTGTGSKELAAMTEEIRVQEVRLNNIKHPLSSDAEAVALQVRAFLAKARQAASDNDLDGARTLTTKAKLLLDELSSS